MTVSLGCCGVVDLCYEDRADSSRSSTGAESPFVPSEETSNLEEPWVRTASAVRRDSTLVSTLRRSPLECYFLPRSFYLFFFFCFFLSPLAVRDIYLFVRTRQCYTSKIFTFNYYFITPL